MKRAARVTTLANAHRIRDDIPAPATMEMAAGRDPSNGDLAV